MPTLPMKTGVTAMKRSTALLVALPVFVASVFSAPMVGEVSTNELTSFWLAVWLIVQVVTTFAYFEEAGI